MALSSKEGSWKASLYGIAGGLVSALTGHPMDTLKTRLQTQKLDMTASRPSWRLLTRMVRTMAASPSLLWKGLAPQLIASPLAWAANFAAFSAALPFTGSETTLQHFTAGFVSGAAWAVTVSPFELLKCRAQVTGQRTSDVLRTMRKRYPTLPSMAGALTRGIHLTTARDTLGMGVWFATYHVVKVHLEWSPFVAGGLCGCSTWLAVMPIDMVKTRYQTHDTLSLQEVVRDVWRHQGSWSVNMIPTGVLTTHLSLRRRDSSTVDFFSVARSPL